MSVNATFLGQAIFFTILIWFSWRFIWPPLMRAIEDRQAKIADGLAAAERSQKDLAQAEDKVNELLREARGKANEIIDQAHARANQIVDQSKQEAIAVANRQKAMAEAEIAAAANRARDELRQQLGALAVAGAEKLIRREIDGRVHQTLLDDLATQL